MSNLHSQDFQIQLKRGLAASINATATINTAVEGEPHYTTDSETLYIYDGALNRPVAAQVPVLSETGDYTATNGDYIIDVTCSTADITITLPAGSTNKTFAVSKADSTGYKVTIACDGAETINGSATLDILYQYSTVQLFWNGTEWRIK
jgi:VCBS repeat-containing protein